jgi:hypothetical protein
MSRGWHRRQAATVEEVTTYLKEAVELFLECAGPKEIRQRVRRQFLDQSGIPRSTFES